jgi:zinc protease
VIFEATPASNVATVMLLINAGAREDPAGREGLAHLVEHLAFRGSRVRQAKSGSLAVMGVEDHASTGHDWVNFKARGPVVSMEVMVKEQAAKLSTPLGGLTAPAFEVERNVVRNELRETRETDIKGQSVEWNNEALFAAPHPYHRRVIGTHESLAAISLAETREWTTAHYRPDRATMVVTGALEPKEIESLIKDLPPEVCGGLLRPFKPSPRQPTTFAEVESHEPLPLSRRTGEVRAPELWVGWRVPGIVDPADPVADVWTHLLQDNLRVVHLNDGDVTSLSCFADQRELGSFIGCRLGLASAAHADATATRLKDVLGNLGANLEARLPRTKGTMKLQEAYLAETPWVRAQDRGLLAHFRGVFDAGAYDPQTWQAVSIEMLQAFQQKYLAPELARVTLVEPSEETARPPPGPPADARAAAPDLNWSIYATSVLDDLVGIRFVSDLWSSTLPNGLELIVLPRRQAPIVTSVVAFRVGAGDEAASIAADDAMKTILDLPPPDGSLLLGSAFTERYVSMSAGGRWEDLDAEIAVLARAVRRYDVQWPSSTFQHETLPRLRENDAAPPTKTYRELASKLFGTHPLGRPVRADDASALSKQQIVDFLRRTIAPQNAILVVVGDVRPAQVLSAVQRELLDWPATASSRIEFPPALRPDSVRTTQAARFASPGVAARPGASQVQIYLGCVLPPGDPAKDARYDIAADILASQMAFDLREKLGATYGVQGGARSLMGGTAYIWMTTAIGNDELRGALGTMRMFWGEFASGQRTTNSVRGVQIAHIRDRIFELESGAQIAERIVSTWLTGWPLVAIDQYASHIRAVSAGDVDRVLRGCAEHLAVAMSGDPRVIRAAMTGSPETPDAPPAPTVLGPDKRAEPRAPAVPQRSDAE